MSERRPPAMMLPRNRWHRLRNLCIFVIVCYSLTMVYNKTFVSNHDMISKSEDSSDFDSIIQPRRTQNDEPKKKWTREEFDGQLLLDTLPQGGTHKLEMLDKRKLLEHSEKEKKVDEGKPKKEKSKKPTSSHSMEATTEAGGAGRDANSPHGTQTHDVTQKLRSNKSEHQYFDNKGHCLPLYGRVVVIVLYVTESYETHYKIAQQTLRCYVNRTGYELKLVDMKVDALTRQHCSQYKQLFFLKHCSVAAHLNESDWLVVLDADAAVVNPSHCFEEYIDPDKQLIFYERFFNWEIASGNYIVKNTPWSREFLLRWADYETKQPKEAFTGADNGALQILLLRTLQPDAHLEVDMCEQMWNEARTFEQYMKYVVCVKVARGAHFEWPGKIKIFRRVHGWIWDWFMTNDNLCNRTFMHHGWKFNEIGTNGWNSPFQRPPSGEDCKPNAPWPYRKSSQTDCAAIARQMRVNEQGSARGYAKDAKVLPYLDAPDIGRCWPNCEEPPEKWIYTIAPKTRTTTAKAP